MNILHISRQFYPCVGGIETYIYEISKQCIVKGEQCRVLTLDYSLINKRKKFPKYTCHEGIEIFRIAGFGYYKKPLPLEFITHLLQWASVVHLHEMRFLYESALFFKQFMKYKIVLSSHGFLFHTQDLKMLKTIITSLYYKPTIKYFIDAVVCVSKHDLVNLQKLKLKNLYSIGNGVDFYKFNVIAKKLQPGKLLYFGKIASYKGVDLLLQCLACMKECNWECVIVGEGFPHIVERMKVMAHELGISHRAGWRGILAEKELFRELSEAHLCLFPSRYEGFGYTLIEAMAAGCICVCNSIATYQEIIEDQVNGFLVNFLNYRETAEKIKGLLHIPIERLRYISENAKCIAKKHDWRRKIGLLLSLYQKMNNT